MTARVRTFFNGTHLIELTIDEDNKFTLRCAFADINGERVGPWELPKQNVWYKEKNKMLEEIILQLIEK